MDQSRGRLRRARLQPRQASFVGHYLVELNATQAALKAGYSAKTAASQAADLLKLPKIQVAIARVQSRRLERLEVRAVDVLEQLRRIAFCDVREFFGVDGVPLSIDQLPPELATCVDLDSDGKTVKIRLRPADALDKLARHFELLRPELALPAPVNIGNVTNINVTEVILEQLSTEELRVVEKMLLLKSAACQPGQENPSVDGGGLRPTNPRQGISSPPCAVMHRDLGITTEEENSND